MDEIARVFGTLGFGGAETFLASGNVVFESRSRDGAALAAKCEAALSAALGYKVDVFVRTDAEVSSIVRHRPFPAAEL